MKRFMEEGIPQKRKDRSFEKKMPLKDYGFSPDSSMEEGKKKKYSMDRALLPPRGSRPSRYPTADRVSHRHCHRDATTCSYDIVFCVEGEKEEAAQDDRLLSCFVSYMKWYTININADGPGGKVYPKRLLPFSKGQMPLFAALAALGSHIYCFGGKTSSRQPIRDVLKLRVPPRVAKEGEKWVPVSPRMISQRKSLFASVLSGKIYVCNDLPCNHTDVHWGEVFDPVSRNWEALPNPPSYDHDWLVIYATLENPDRIIVAFCVPEDTSSAIFYEYNVQHCSWKELGPGRRKLHPMYCNDWVSSAVSVGNRLYWVRRKYDDVTLLMIAYDLDLDVWLEGPVKGLESSSFSHYVRKDGPGLPGLIYLEKQRFCLLECTIDNYLRCIVIDVSHRPLDKTLGMSVVWDQSYKMESEIRNGIPKEISYCAIL